MIFMFCKVILGKKLKISSNCEGTDVKSLWNESLFVLHKIDSSHFSETVFKFNFVAILIIWESWK